MTTLDPHLDLDQLSAAVDGTGDGAVASHLSSCLSCRQQVTTWRSALAQVRDLPTVPDPEPAVEAALSVWDELAAEGDQDPAPVPANVVRLRPPRAAAGRRWWLRTRLKPLAASVAVVCVAVAGFFGLGQLLGPGHGSSSAPVASAAPALRAGTTSTLVADLRSVVHQNGTLAGTPPCWRQAGRIAAKQSAGPARYSAPVVLSGVAGEVIVFADGDQYLALVLRSPTCALLADLRY